jgi:hypothetical protein
MAFGGNKIAAYAIIGSVGLVVLILIASLMLVELRTLLQKNTPKAPF